MKLSTRELVTLAVFGTVWGMSEISLGSVLHAFHVPMAGVFLTAVGISIAVIGRVFVPKRGTTLFIGVIAMLLKLLSVGSVILGPMMGILAGALIGEIVMSAFKRPSSATFILAGSLAVLWTLVQPFVAGLLFFGRDLLIVWLDLLDEGSRLLGLDPTATWLVLLLLVASRVAIGALAGWLAWNVAIAVRIRLRGEPQAIPGLLDPLSRHK